jgi:hypothetical protein
VPEPRKKKSARSGSVLEAIPDCGMSPQNAEILASLVFINESAVETEVPFWRQPTGGAKMTRMEKYEGKYGEAAGHELYDSLLGWMQTARWLDQTKDTRKRVQAAERHRQAGERLLNAKRQCGLPV